LVELVELEQLELLIVFFTPNNFKLAKELIQILGDAKQKIPDKLYEFATMAKNIRTGGGHGRWTRHSVGSTNPTNTMSGYGGGYASGYGGGYGGNPTSSVVSANATTSTWDPSSAYNTATPPWQPTNPNLSTNGNGNSTNNTSVTPKVTTNTFSRQSNPPPSNFYPSSTGTPNDFSGNRSSSSYSGAASSRYGSGDGAYSSSGSYHR